MKVYKCNDCLRDGGPCMLTFEESAAEPTLCPFTSIRDNDANWELVIDSKKDQEEIESEG